MADLKDDILEIGLPLVNATDLEGVDEYEFARNTLPYVDLTPMDTTSVESFSEGLRLYKLKKITDIPRIRIYFEHEGSITESYTNELSETFLSTILRPFERMGQVTQILGQPVTGVVKDLIDEIPIIGNITTKTIGGMYKTLPDWIQSAIQTSLHGDHFELPKLWGGSNANISYNLSFRLYCNNPQNDNEYVSRIVNPIYLLLRYTLPRAASKKGVTFKWPPFVMADAGALFFVPEGMITDLTFEKAPEAGTLSVTANRPSMVNVRMTITSIRNILPQDWKDKTMTLPFKLQHYIEHMLAKDPPLLQASAQNSGLSQPVSQVTIPSKNLSDSDKDLYNQLK